MTVRREIAFVYISWLFDKFRDMSDELLDKALRKILKGWF